MPIVFVSALQVPARNQSAGPHAELDIERMPRESILD
jgi:hypothetical protein